MHNGTLGIGLSTAAGIAYGRKLNNEKGSTFMSDGELRGQIWEALQVSVFMIRKFMGYC